MWGAGPGGSNLRPGSGSYMLPASFLLSDSVFLVLLIASDSLSGIYHYGSRKSV